jgi:hypothetical protein
MINRCGGSIVSVSLCAGPECINTPSVYVCDSALEISTNRRRVHLARLLTGAFHLAHSVPATQTHTKMVGQLMPSGMENSDANVSRRRCDSICVPKGAVGEKYMVCLFRCSLRQTEQSRTEISFVSINAPR